MISLGGEGPPVDFPFASFPYDTPEEKSSADRQIEALKKLGWRILGKRTWIHMSVNLPPTEVPDAPDIQDTHWMVVMAIWNIRSEPSTLKGDKTILGQLHKGDVVKELGETIDWVKHDGGKTGIAGWSGKKGMTFIQG